MKDRLLELDRRICPHRGIGQENTLEAIQEGLKTEPFLLEFDVQMHDYDLFLGHPPLLNTETTLEQALNLYVGHRTTPKVDVKLTTISMHQAIDRLIAIAGSYKSKMLVNLSGSLSSSQYMAAEKYLIQAASPYILLNIDLGRYQECAAEVIQQHLEELSGKIFSISPNLEDDIQPVIETATTYDVHHIHFWTLPDRTYLKSALAIRMEQLLDRGFEVYFDVQIDCLTD